MTRPKRGNQKEGTSVPLRNTGLQSQRLEAESEGGTEKKLDFLRAMTYKGHSGMKMTIQRAAS